MEDVLRMYKDIFSFFERYGFPEVGKAIVSEAIEISKDGKTIFS